MEDPISSSPPKYSKASAYPSHVQSSVAKRGARSSQPQPFKLQTEQRGQMKEQAFVRRVKELVEKETKNRIPVAQCLPFTTDKPKNLPKPPVKEQTKPLNFKLHTEQRAARRAGYNYLVANKINSFEILKRFEEKLTKALEEEDIRMMRKEMIPKAQLMPIFDKPFLPQRSSRPPTVPREPNFHLLNKKFYTTSEPYRMHHYFTQSMKAMIK